MNQSISTNNKALWKSIDGQQMLINDPEMLRQKRADPNFDYEEVTFRPRARYVYWAYIEAMLRRVYKVKGTKGRNSPEMRNKRARGLGAREVGNRYWGSRGSYMKKGFLRGFVEVMGARFRAFDGGSDGSGEGRGRGGRAIGGGVYE